MNVLLRVVLTLLIVVAGAIVGIKLTPRLALIAPIPVVGSGNPESKIQSPKSPDWGGGHLSFPVGSAAGILDSVRRASEGDARVRGHDPESTSAFASCPRTRTCSGPSGGVMLRQKSDADYALTLALPSHEQPGRFGLFELPSSDRFKKQLLPGAGDAEAPAPDIPLYPQSSCRMQVGRGTAYFFGFYFTPDRVETVRSYYVRVLGQLGWQRVTADREGLLETFAKPNEDRTVVVQLREQDSVTTRIGLVATATGRKN